MELRICCDASVKLEKMTNTAMVKCDVGSYEVNGDTLNGNIEISGKYMKDVMDEFFEFRDSVPFTLVFKDSNYQVNKITVQDFTSQEIINQGIECNFNILVDYSPREEALVEVEEDEETHVEELIKKIETETDLDDEVADEEIKAEINQKYDDLLNKILESRDDNFLEVVEEEEEEKKVTIKRSESNPDCKSVLSSFKDNYANYRVFYPAKESDIEKICRDQKVSIDKIYKDNKSTDFINKKRIIIK